MLAVEDDELVGAAAVKEAAESALEDDGVRLVCAAVCAVSEPPEAPLVETTELEAAAWRLANTASPIL